MIQTPLLFGLGQALHGMLMRPHGVPLRSLGVVLCPPFGYQNLCTYRPLRTLARRLAEEGWPVLRFDWPGNGDSADPRPDEGIETVATWTDVIREATATLRSSTGVDDVVLTGLGIGGTLAACAASEQDVSGLALLSPYPTGAAYLRELRAFERIAAADHGVMPGPVQGVSTTAVEASGFLVTAEEANAIASIDLLDLDPASVTARHALIAVTHRDRVAATLADWLRATRADVRGEVVPELATVWDEPHLGALPRPCSALVVDWLESLSTQEGQAHEPDVPTRPVMRLAGGIREETIALDGPRGTLVGVTCEPSDGEADGDPWLVFLNAGAIRRSGPGRLWTSYARSWASRGLPSLRLDLSGIGDSDGNPAQDERTSDEVGRLYVTDFAEDVSTAVRWIERRAGAPRIALLGLCSGAYWSLHTALSHGGASFVVLVNPAVLFWDEHVPSMHALGLAGRLLRSPRRWHRVLMRGARVHGRQAVRGAALLALGRVDEGWHARSIRAALERLAEQRVSMLMVFSPGHPGLLYLEKHLGPGYRAELEHNGVSLEIVPGADHTFRPLATHGLLRVAVERHLERLGFLQGAVEGQTRSSADDTQRHFEASA
jgi:pimeloyl-ACP methyl ester carboxylesterase